MKGTPTRPIAIGMLDTTGAFGEGLIVMINAEEDPVPVLFAALTCNVSVPGCVGFPEITPVAAASERPFAGSPVAR